MMLRPLILAAAGVVLVWALHELRTTLAGAYAFYIKRENNSLVGPW